MGVCALAVLGVTLATADVAGSAPQQPTIRCPVTNEPAYSTYWLDYRGAKLYFCCRDCVGKYQADPAKYTMRANYQLALTRQARQVACPFTGQALNPKIAPMRVGDLEIGFCCRACQQTVAVADAQTRLELVFGDAFTRGFAIIKQ